MQRGTTNEPDSRLRDVWQKARGDSVSELGLKVDYDMTSFEKKCSVCDGGGIIWRMAPYKNSDCETCAGRGIVPNDPGSDLLKFLKKYQPAPVASVEEPR